MLKETKELAGAIFGLLQSVAKLWQTSNSSPVMDLSKRMTATNQAQAVEKSLFCENRGLEMLVAFGGILKGRFFNSAGPASRWLDGCAHHLSNPTHR